MADHGNESFLIAVDLHGLIHAVEETDMPNKGKAFWKRCGGGDIPAGAKLLRNGEVTCPNCAKILERERHAG
ncbi:hypothetical protein [Mesorhizobium sp. CN2-181]|uniref:hypothetical protein n=1 Tax=Mesorhizobium yinganensis TaxID=3157707 RepID=UPI0032B8376A